MRVQTLTTGLLVSLMMWGVIYYASRETYRAAYHNGVIPNLHIKKNLGFD